MTTRCCIAGGGPAGMMLGLLLARAGVDTVVLEKHADFLRDFRGDTIHPSTLDVMHELGLLDAFLKLPHQKITRLSAAFGDATLNFADMTHLPTRCKFIALMPQWDFLNFIAAEGKRYPAFKLMMRAEATGLVEENGRIAGVAASTADGPVEIRARLTVGADGRHSSCARNPASRSRSSARRWTSCGSTCRARPAIRIRSWAGSAPAACSSCSTAAIIGNAAS